MVRSIMNFVLSWLVILFLTSDSFANDKLLVFVSIAPQKYFVEQIGKNHVNVKVMVRTGADPHTYEPKPQQMAAIARAKLYFAIGIEFEKANLDKIVSTNPMLKVVHLDHGIQKIPMAGHHHHDEKSEHDQKNEHQKKGEPGESSEANEHGGDHHEHGGMDPHIWLSPPLVKIQARTILTALQEIDPVHRAVYEANYRNFIASVDQLDADLKTIFAGKQGLEFMVFHPAWGYFAHAYGLEQIPIEVEGKNPKPAHLKKLIEHARERNIKVIFVQPQFSARNAELVAREIGGRVAFADPLAENWLANLSEVAELFKAALR